MSQIKHFQQVNLLLFLQDITKDKNILFLQEKNAPALELVLSQVKS